MVVSAVFVVALAGIFLRAKDGLSGYTIGLILTTIILFMATISFMFVEQTQMESIYKLMFTAAGFAGGIFSARASSS
jgi:hypothetical protein